MKNTREKGTEAENFCKDFFINLRWTLVGQNVFVSRGEIDLIFVSDNKIKFVEVRSSKPDFFNLKYVDSILFSSFQLELVISEKKKSNLKSTITNFLNLNKQYNNHVVEIDLFLILGNRFTIVSDFLGF